MRFYLFLLLGACVNNLAFADFFVETRLNTLFTNTEESDTTTWVSLDLFDNPVDNYLYSAEETDSRQSNIVTNIYFGRVLTFDVPHAEAGFLSQRGKATVDLGARTEDSEGSDLYFENGSSISPGYFKVKTNSAHLNLDAEFVMPRFPIILGFGVGLLAMESEFSGRIAGFNYFDESEFDRTHYSAMLGAYYSDSGRVSYHFEDATFEDENNNTVVDETIQTLHIKHVFSFSNKMHVALEGNFLRYKYNYESDGSSSTSRYTDLSATFYPNNHLGIGLQVTHANAPDLFEDNMNRYQLSAEYYFSQYVGAELSYQWGSVSNNLGVDFLPADALIGSREGKYEADSLNISLILHF